MEQEMPGALDVSSRKSVVLDRWLNDPKVDSRALFNLQIVKSEFFAGEFHYN